MINIENWTSNLRRNWRRKGYSGSWKSLKNLGLKDCRNVVELDSLIGFNSSSFLPIDPNFTSNGNTMYQRSIPFLATIFYLHGERASNLITADNKISPHFFAIPRLSALQFFPNKSPTCPCQGQRCSLLGTCPPVKKKHGPNSTIRG